LLDSLQKINKPYFGCADIAAALKVTPASAKVAAARLLRQGFLLRLKRNTYILKEKWNSLTAEDKFCAANLLQVPSYISLISALSYYDALSTK
jgi:predicted transcriptional regulator of viral defense system